MMHGAAGWTKRAGCMANKRSCQLATARDQPGSDATIPSGLYRGAPRCSCLRTGFSFSLLVVTLSIADVAVSLIFVATSLHQDEAKSQQVYWGNSRSCQHLMLIMPGELPGCVLQD
jgi:hypothetical protein